MIVKFETGSLIKLKMCVSSKNKPFNIGDVGLVLKECPGFLPNYLIFIDGAIVEMNRRYFEELK